MNKTIAILVLGFLPPVALACGVVAAGHEEHNMEQMDHLHNAGIAQHAHEVDDAAGHPGAPALVNRTINVVMNDTMRFVPDEMKLRSGDTVRFVVRNNGQIRHEMVLGSAEELKEHAAMMRASPGMQHSDPNMISLDTGQQGELVWLFDRPGTYEFACLVPGHMEAGMSGKIEVK